MSYFIKALVIFLRPKYLEFMAEEMLLTNGLSVYYIAAAITAGTNLALRAGRPIEDLCVQGKV
jgi:hypothetical protein